MIEQPKMAEAEQRAQYWANGAPTRPEPVGLEPRLSMTTKKHF